MPAKMDSQTEKRSKELCERGFKYNGSEYVYKNDTFFAAFHWTDLMCYSDEEWKKNLKEIDDRIKKEGT